MKKKEFIPIEIQNILTKKEEVMYYVRLDKEEIAILYNYYLNHKKVFVSLYKNQHTDAQFYTSLFGTLFIVMLLIIWHPLCLAGILLYFPLNKGIQHISVCIDYRKMVDRLENLLQDDLDNLYKEFSQSKKLFNNKNKKLMAELLATRSKYAIEEKQKSSLASTDENDLSLYQAKDFKQDDVAINPRQKIKKRVLKK